MNSGGDAELLTEAHSSDKDLRNFRSLKKKRKKEISEVCPTLQDPHVKPEVRYTIETTDEAEGQSKN